MKVKWCETTDLGGYQCLGKPIFSKELQSASAPAKPPPINFNVTP
jgi:hypothetical protein